MSDDITPRIRVAVEEDASVVAGIHMASRSATMPYLPPQKRDHEQVSRWVRDVVLKRCRTWVAVRRAETVGYAALDGDTLDHLYLRPDVRRQGIGNSFSTKSGGTARKDWSCTSSSRTSVPARSTNVTVSPSWTSATGAGTWRTCRT
ncbi:GNAT family N-acetyltransferase [Streptomyces althioticus]|uniref:GNAT family N-acetyltransferase n=1 Tax=Streptomyces althioticus TaxID=83380 RepID=UPI0036F88BE6